MAPHRISTGQTSMTAASSALHQAKPKDHSTEAAITTARIGHNHIQRLANSGHFTNLMASSTVIAGAPA